MSRDRDTIIEAQLIDDLRSWAGEHVAQSDGQLQLLPYEPDKYPGQYGYVVAGDPQSAAVVDTIAQIAQPRYEEVKARLTEQEDATGEVSRIGELLKGGNNVALITNHGNLVDIAITHVTLYSALDQMGYEPRTGIIISKMVSFLAYILGSEPAPTVEVLKMLEHDTFLSYPRTGSLRERELGHLSLRAIDNHNRQMRKRVHTRLRQGSMLLAVAASGTVDKPRSEEDPDTLVMAGVGTGTKEILRAPRTYRVPIAVEYELSDDVVFDICDVPRITRSDSEVDESMELIAHRLSQRVPGKNYVYKQAA